MKRLCAFALAWSMMGCQSNDAGSWKDALLAEDDTDGRAQVGEVIAAALGRDVRLAGDAFTQESLLTLEHTAPARLNAPAATGRVMERPEQFRLVKRGSTCAVLRVKTEEVLTLEDVRCTDR